MTRLMRIGPSIIFEVIEVIDGSICIEYDVKYFKGDLGLTITVLSERENEKLSETFPDIVIFCDADV